MKKAAYSFLRRSTTEPLLTTHNTTSPPVPQPAAVAVAASSTLTAAATSASSANSNDNNINSEFIVEGDNSMFSSKRSRQSEDTVGGDSKTQLQILLDEYNSLRARINAKEKELDKLDLKQEQAGVLVQIKEEEVKAAREKVDAIDPISNPSKYKQALSDLKDAKLAHFEAKEHDLIEAKLEKDKTEGQAKLDIATDEDDKLLWKNPTQ